MLPCPGPRSLWATQGSSFLACLSPLSLLCFSFVYKLPRPLDMLTQRWMLHHREQYQVYLIRDRRFLERTNEVPQNIDIQPLTNQGDIDVGSRSMGTLSTGAEQYSLFHPGFPGEDSANGRQRRGRQAPLPLAHISSENRRSSSRNAG